MRPTFPFAIINLACGVAAAPVFLESWFAGHWKDALSSSERGNRAAADGPSLDTSKSMEVAAKNPTSTASTSKAESTGPSTEPLPSPLFVVYDSAPDLLPDPKALDGNNVLLLTFWGSSAPTSNAATFAALSPEERAKTHAAYKEAGVRLGVSAFGSLETPVTSGEDPVQTANSLAAWVKEMNLDLVDIDFEDFAAMSSGTAVDWLISFQKALRAALPAAVKISHAPIAPWFSQDATQFGGGYLKIYEAVGDSIDFIIAQLYNQKELYTDCETLVTKSTQYPGTSILELSKVVPPKQVVLGKTSSEAATPNGGYLAPDALAACVEQAKAGGWSGGLMFWAWPEADGLRSAVWGS